MLLMKIIHIVNMTSVFNKEKTLQSQSELLTSRLIFDLMASVCIFILCRKWSPEAWKPSCSSDVMQLDQIESEYFSYLPSETQMETIKDCTETKLRMNVA